MNFLRYLQYWKKPEYIQMLTFPQCLAFLDNILENNAFRRELALPQFIDFVHQQQGAQWLVNNHTEEHTDDEDVPA
jgi:mediator of RNA polymerase II transcription subunit 31